MNIIVSIIALHSIVSYIDPNTGGILFQALLPILAVIGTALVIFWRRIKLAIMAFFSVFKNKK